jgi:hypothetical protein
VASLPVIGGRVIRYCWIQGATQVPGVWHPDPAFWGTQFIPFKQLFRPAFWLGWFCRRGNRAMEVGT